MTSGTPSKRFLCQAPRPDAWDDLAEDVLGNLGSSREKRIASIRESLVRAKRRNPFTPKAGPGRKTNTEHAIAFYEYLLEKLDAELPRADETSETIRNKEESEDDEEEDEEDTEELSLPSCEITPCTKKSDAEKKHLCRVCDEQGELVSCSECNVHFHKTCVRPTMTTPPEDKAYRCSYCVLLTEPKNSKPRRQAAAAVRMMARLRNRCRRVKETAKRKGDEPKPDAQSTLQESASLAEANPDKNGIDIQYAVENENSPSKKRIQSKEEASTPTNEETPDKTPTALSADTDDSQGRAKRARKQPTLYDPQLCPASKWESDDVRAKKTVDSESSDTSDDDSATTNGNAESRTPIHRDHNQDDVWCNFCGDDSYIKVCCFCACRVCFGKHHQTKLLLCDRCDDEYHTFCLDPPLQAVPKKKWFCPNCAQSEEKRCGRTSSRVETRGKWKSQGSSRAAEHSASPTRQTSKGAEHRANQEQPRDPSGRFLSPGAGRGRSKTPKTSTPELPRKRGRPPSANKALGSQRKAPKDSSSRGRKLNSSQDSGNISKSSPHSSDSTLRRKQEIDGEASGAVSVTMSRSGRTLKRSPFHDELSSGEQNLRVGRPVTEPATYQGYATLQQDSSVSVSTGGSLPLQPMFSGGMSADGAEIRNTPEAVVVARSDELGLQSTKSSPQSSSRIGLREGLAATSSKVLDTDQPFASGLSIDASNPTEQTSVVMTVEGKVPRRKPGARECMQISRRFGVDVIPQKYIDILLDYCKRGKVEHLIRMRERLDDHARFLESQLAGLEARLQEKDAETRTSSMVLKPNQKSLNNEP
ncbi:E3 ubiquitin-protein ligase UHRF1 [Fistulifera solaris]|uniref:E3 ubiquitin-protein ligase UHRF1 n=1 Tax=Fistulifera solaris TaxID=1519565 RepID=A0A1Z5KRH2_FISSO|nr:E3 ubiquitin-protein ligase UHRF1 [Fistulifera solaris]|eukprot:GAX28920.1 E3 ubiquitin-protein ligase UHRF1 [Fistulifera solaris]